MTRQEPSPGAFSTNAAREHTGVCKPLSVGGLMWSKPVAPTSEAAVGQHRLLGERQQNSFIDANHSRNDYDPTLTTLADRLLACDRLRQHEPD
jgi:hypothetical protein